MATDVLCYGATLARRMPADQASGHVEYLMDIGRAVGAVSIALVRDNTPGVLNVECVLESVGVLQALNAIRIADRQLRRLHDVDLPPLAPAVPGTTAEALRAKAEDLVDLCRNARFEVAGGPTPAIRFDASREDCVRAIMLALGSFLASAEPVPAAEAKAVMPGISEGEARLLAAVEAACTGKPAAAEVEA